MSCIPFLAALGIAVSGCAEEKRVDAPAIERPTTFYLKLDNSYAKVDPIAARDIISTYRRNSGLPTVAIDAQLQKEAEVQAASMAKANTAGRSIRGSLKSRLSATGYHFGAAVENTSAGYHTLAEAFSGWRQSSPHNSNMLHPAIRRIGIATAYSINSRYKVFWALILTD